MSLEEYPDWLKGIDIFIGLVIVLVGAWILISPDLAETTLVITIAIGLSLIGLVRVGKGTSMTTLTRTSRAMKILSGLGAITLSILSFVFSSLTVTFLIHHFDFRNNASWTIKNHCWL